MKADDEIEAEEQQDEVREWHEVRPWLWLVLGLFLIAAIANWRALHP